MTETIGIIANFIDIIDDTRSVDRNESELSPSMSHEIIDRQKRCYLPAVARQ